MILRAVSFLTNCLLIILSASLSLLVAEYSVRALLPAYDPSGQLALSRLPDGTPIGPPGAVVRHRKNTGDYDVEVSFNEHGFRDEKPLATARRHDLFVVGDSFAFGWGVDEEDRFSNQLQSIIGRPVFNIAMPGSDLEIYDRLIRYVEANGIRVKNLIISITMENDIRLYAGSVADILHQDLGLSPLALLRLEMLKRFLARNSALYGVVTHFVHQTAWLRAIAVRTGLITPNLLGIGDENASEDQIHSSVQRVLRIASSELNVLVMIIPSRSLWVGATVRRSRADEVHIRFVRNLIARGVMVLDMRDCLEAQRKPLSYHFLNDGHWNRAGHALAAQRLAGALKKGASP